MPAPGDAERPTGPYPGEQPAMRERELPALPAWMAPLLIVAVVIVAVLVMANHGAPGTTSDPAVTAARVTTTDDGSFRLTLQAERGTYAAGQPIVAGASIVYLGPKPSVGVSGAPGTVLFGVEEIGGEGRSIPPGSRAACFPTTFDRGVTAYVPWAATGELDLDAPGDAWIRDYLGVDRAGTPTREGPGFVLPAGTWRLLATASFGESDDCEHGPFHSLEASVVVTVQAPDAASPAG